MEDLRAMFGGFVNTCVCVLERTHIFLSVQRPNSWAKIQTKVLRVPSLLFTVTFTALPRDLYFFKITQTLMYFFILTQPLTYFYISVTVHCKGEGGKPHRKPYPLPYGLKNPYRNLKSENSQDYAQRGNS
jgi:hypothetical protein